MDLENSNWDQADQDFSIWLNGDNNGINLPHSEILKSAYLTFRQRQIKSLLSICELAFEYYQKQVEEIDFFSSKELKNDFNFSINQEPEEEYDTPMFRKSTRVIFDFDNWARKNNEKIINGIIAGNQEVFFYLYEFEFPKVVRLIEKYSGNQEMAKDVFQDAIIILIEKIYTKKLDLTCSVNTYLYSICKFLWLDQLRQNLKEKQMIKLSDEEYTTNDISVPFYNTPDIFENVNLEIKKLGNPCQQLLECYYYKCMSWDEIAGILGYTNAASARNQKYKCLERIRKTVIGKLK
ncbi:MAG: sigma-70 family RNA polymerase sigma factor [Prolixibacteraceae bacterium]